MKRWQCLDHVIYEGREAVVHAAFRGPSKALESSWYYDIKAGPQMVYGVPESELQDKPA